jgi:hypothetical protein
MISIILSVILAPLHCQQLREKRFHFSIDRLTFLKENKLQTYHSNTTSIYTGGIVHRKQLRQYEIHYGVGLLVGSLTCLSSAVAFNFFVGILYTVLTD